MEHTIAKDAFSGLSGNNAVYNAICIAVCDDEQFMCDMIEEKIKEMLPDAVVCKFFSAQELLDSETQIDILFLDIQMPEMDGMEAARLFRRDWKQALIIFVILIFLGMSVSMQYWTQRMILVVQMISL